MAAAGATTLGHRGSAPPQNSDVTHHEDGNWVRHSSAALVLGILAECIQRLEAGLGQGMQRAATVRDWIEENQLNRW